MQQLEIKFFWPLTEQIPLDLDFKPSEEYEDEKRAVRYWANNTIASGMFTSGILTGSSSTITQNFIVDVDNTPITVMSKEKPNFIKRYIYKILGVQWKAK